jgi:hypothetical protein
MADVIQLTDGTTTIDLYYDTSGFQFKSDGNSFGVADHDNVMHSPINRDGEVIVRHRLENKEWPLSLRVSGTSNDNVFDTINALGRIAEQARRYELNDDVDKVYLSMQMDGCTYATYYDVKDILYDEIGVFNYYNVRADELTFDDAFSINVVTHPTGYTDEVMLCNEVYTAGFMEDYNGDGLADNWNLVSTPSPYSLDTTNYLVGDRSQELTCASGEGIETDSISLPSTLYRGESFRAYVWVYRSSGSAEITAYVIGDVAGTLDSATYSTATITDTDDDSKTWYKLELSGTIGASDNSLTLRVTAGGSCTYFVDKAYLQLDTTYMPSEWMSCAHVVNHYNSSQYFAAATEGTIPYIDVVGIRGDRPAYPKIIIRADDANTTVRYIKITNAATEGIQNIGSTADSFYIQYTGTAGSDRSGGSYHGDTVNDSSADPRVWTKIQTVDASVFEKEAWVGEVIVFTSIMTADTRDLLVRGNFKFASEDYEENLSEVTYIVESAWRLVATGPIIVPNMRENAINGLAALECIFPGSGGTGTVNVDFALFAPIADGCMMMDTVEALTEAGLRAITIDMDRRAAFTTSYTAGPDWSEDMTLQGRVQTGLLGREIRLIPERPNKMFVLCTEANNVHDIDTGNVKVFIKYEPQTRFLFGDT